MTPTNTTIYISLVECFTSFGQNTTYTSVQAAVPLGTRHASTLEAGHAAVLNTYTAIMLERDYICHALHLCTCYNYIAESSMKQGRLVVYDEVAIVEQCYVSLHHRQPLPAA